MAEISTSEKKVGKQLYGYQKDALQEIFRRFEDAPQDYHLLYQLPTGGGKTVIFSEIVRRYLEKFKKKVLVLTHRIELSKQTSKMLDEFGVNNKIINSTAKLDDQDEYSCFVAMVETLKNRLNDEKLDISDIGLVIVDEAHYNSFTKIFKFFDKSFILGVTATPLSSNVKLPMYENYQELFVGESIQHLIDNEYLASANLYSYNVGLTSLEVGANGDYTVKSSEDLYTNSDMLSKLVSAYEETAKGKKTLIFNNGINTSIQVYHAFKKAGYPIAHLDNTNTRKERDFILKWFHKTPNAIITSVSILTTGFDEPSIEAIILNRATKSLTLYYQMIGRGSRIYSKKNTFEVIDLGNNFHRFGPWGADLDWQKMFRAPDYYLNAILSDEDIESTFRYELPADVKKEFANSQDTYFDMKHVYIDTIRAGESSKRVLEKSIEHHAKMCIENSEDVFDALILAKKLGEEIDDRINRYAKCISKSTHNFVTWLKDDYRKKLNAFLRSNFDEMFEEIYGYPPED
ncbi:MULTISPECIES: DEAD/DEAH box helicase [unclassified Polaribacter]|uniref:DEAD/DEAH box helicase n=1 Tax=unclassified Polaribacter TaxID=196858 RepID=UPI00052E0AB1|nr:MULTISPECIES: DEAD/DEAH box helicase family protein [unclassified Polaribacter]MBT3741318.1 DEAD/DEAH box helicase family protein [Polaribacter sp.]KGL61020.1 ATP-dependent helicase [Polaribacter sp. Hel1_33_49]MBT4414019.1 DEAD/DEAH box helicase family protein [Polaribacter sp.]MBT7815230.1 DEAD/DEAH box helicase family protein [Polaribacter sp.]PKV64693.1 superfamily II DNA or RNA helicase [Polaribacter sp. Hel1_33_96]